MNVTFEDVKNNRDIKAYISKADESLLALGYTEHSFAHVHKVSELAGRILQLLGYDDHQVELAKIAGYMHDIGNAINRKSHAEYGAILANDILKQTDLSLEDRIEIVSCIGNHDESTGSAFDAISAAVILADKTDVRKNRVREKDRVTFDIHDRVNFAVTNRKLKVHREKKVITLNLEIDENICTMYDYFEIFLGRT